MKLLFLLSLVIGWTLRPFGMTVWLSRDVTMRPGADGWMHAELRGPIHWGFGRLSTRSP